MTETRDVHVRQSDAFAWSMERDPLLRSTITGVVVFAEAPRWDVFVERIDRATRLSPSFRQRLIESPLKLAPPRFEFDPDFDLLWHIRRVGAPPPGTLEAVFDFARTTGMGAFDPARPLWEFTLVEGIEGGRAALVLKVHHSLTDGIGGIQLAQHIVDFEPDPGDLGPMPTIPAVGRDGWGPPPNGSLGRLLDAIGWDLAHVASAGIGLVTALPGDALRALRDPVGAVGDVIERTSSILRFVAPVTDTRSPLMVDRRRLWHFDALEVSLPDLKKAGKQAGGSLNDAFLAGVTGGLRRYHEAFGVGIHDLRLTMPISLRAEGDPEGGNRVTIVRFDVPAGIVDAEERIQEIGRICATQRGEPALAYSDAIAGVLNLLPNPVIGGMLKHVDFLASNVPGLTTPVWLGGALMEGFYVFGPTLGSSANVTLMSYRGQCCIGVNVDTGAVQDPAMFLACLVEGFEEVLAVGGEHDPVRLVVPDRTTTG
ncbi:MAG TPA: wax ester/triacylglycerol synthase domain-containing protein [Acidimicrobiales bacterium]